MEILRKKIAQLICIGFDGSDLNHSPKLKDWLAHDDGIGALILFDYDYKKQVFDKNIKTLNQLKKLNHDIKTFYQAQHPNSPQIWLSIDVEGGKVDRLSKLDSYSNLPSPKKIASLTQAERNQHWKNHALLLQELKIDLNFSPVVDLDLSPYEGIFGPLERCFSDDPIIVAKMANDYIQILNQHHILACLKHFPGHGSARGDSHLDFVDVSDTFILEELRPYQLIQVQPNLLYSVMTAHVINRQLDSKGIPATLSKNILSDLLRAEFGFQGIIISDDLQMKAISKYYSRKDALLKTLKAGSDMFIFGNQLGWDEPQDIINDVVDLVQNNLISEKIINEAYERVLKYKHLINKSIG
jgi:beta-N-acetylhexosaminidase